MTKNMLIFFAAYLLMGGSRSLWEDAIGIDGYIAYVRACWISPWISVPLAIVMILVGLLLLSKAAKKKEG